MCIWLPDADGDAGDFGEGGESLGGFFEAVSAHESQAVLGGGAEDLGDVGASVDLVADGFVGNEEFGDCEAASEPDVTAVVTARAFGEMAFRGVGEADGTEFLGGGSVFGCAVEAVFADEALSEDAEEGAGHEIRFDAEVHEASDGAGGVVRMEGREHEMSGQCGLDRHHGSFFVADFADHDDIGSCRKMLRRPLANVIPFLTLIWV